MKYEKISIGIKGCEQFTITGRYRRDLETTNWHYYELSDGRIMHIRKSELIFVISEKEPKNEV